MIVFPNAKINLGLNVLEKRSDGFHNIETIFYPIPLCDALELLPHENDELVMNFSGFPIAGDHNNNLIAKAYQAIKENCGIGGLKVHLHKAIPMGAGLGGGSSDASFFLKAISEFFDLNLTFGELHHYARMLGSDCSFFINNKPSFGSGRGEELESSPVKLSGYYLVLVKPDVHISTARAYAGVIPNKKTESLESNILQPIETWKDNINNDFELSLFSEFPILASIKTTLVKNGALYAAMSGSGSTVFGIFKKEIDLKHLFKDDFYYSSFLN